MLPLLLLCGREFRRGAVLLIVVNPGQGLAVGRNGGLEDADHLAIAFVSLLEAVLADALDRDGGDAGVALHGRIATVHLGGVALAGAVGHGEFVTVGLVGVGDGVIGHVGHLAHT